jgi:FlaG/FlaF family flagellin (archaellin)
MKQHIFKSKRAVSGIIGAVLLVTVVILASNVAVWYFGQQSSFIALNQSSEQLRQLARLEQLQVSKIVISDQGPPSATVQNLGIVTIHIVDLSITQQTGTVWHQVYHVNYYIPSGALVSNVGTSISATLDPQQNYKMIFITERGTKVMFLYSPNQLFLGDFATFGNVGFLSITFDYPSFQYTSQSQTTSTSAWTLSKNGACKTGSGNGPLFAIKFVNHGTYDAIVQQWSLSQLWLMKDKGGGSTAQDFFVVAPGSYPGHLSQYTNGAATVPKSPTNDWQTGGPATPLLFGATTLAGTTGQTLAGCDTGSIYDFFIEVSYLYNGQYYNQVIPYAATIVTS